VQQPGTYDRSAACAASCSVIGLWYFRSSISTGSLIIAVVVGLSWARPVLTRLKVSAQRHITQSPEILNPDSFDNDHLACLGASAS
jgi:hypothetical protein